MAGFERRWVRVKPLTAQERAHAAAACERFTADAMLHRREAGRSRSALDLPGIDETLRQ